MSTFTKALSEFNEQDVKAMDEALRKFAAYKKADQEVSATKVNNIRSVEARGTGLPDSSPGFVAYTPILSFALLKSHAAVEKLTRVLTVLTCVLATLAIIQVILTVRTGNPL